MTMRKIRNMKRYMTKYLALTGALLMLASLSGCQLDEPVIPAEELYIRGFIKKYGLIDPTQDFSSAMQTNITLSLPDRASVVNVYAQMGSELYRVGCFAELEGTVTLPVDVSEATETIVVDVDGVRYNTVPGGSIDVKSGAPAVASRAGNARDLSESELKELWIDPYKWTSVTTKNGETGKTYDAEGNPRQIIFITKDGTISHEEDPKDKDGDNNYSVDTNNPSVIRKDGIDTRYFNVAKAGHIGENLFGDKTHETVLGANSGSTNPGEVSNTFNGSNVRFLIKNNDDALAAYRFVFRTASKNKGKVRVVLLGQQKTNGSTDNGVYIFLDSHNLNVDADIEHKATLNTDTKDKYTEWELRTELMPRGYYELIIWGVDSEANFDDDQTCGNWGYMSMSRMKTANDMSWILACEDLGTTDDFDFNDVVFSIEAVNTNTAAVKLGVIQWQVVDNTNEGGTVIRKTNVPASREVVDEAGTNEYKTQVKVKALAAGGTLPIWLHFREEDGNTGTGTDYIVCPQYNDGIRGCLKNASEVAATEESQEKANADVTSCSEWHRWFGINKSTTMLNTGTYRHISETSSVTFMTKNVFSLENFCYLKFKVDETQNLPYYFHEDVDLDPWSQKVLQWKWQKEHSQAVTFGFFITVYKPTVSDSSTEINGKEPQNTTDPNYSHVVSKGLPGLPPQMFLIPDCDPMTDTGKSSTVNGWRWPCERVDITNVYPNFTKWVEKATDYYGINWFMLPKTGVTNENVLFYPRDAASQNAYQPFDPFASGSSN